MVSLFAVPLLPSGPKTRTVSRSLLRRVGPGRGWNKKVREVPHQSSGCSDGEKKEWTTPTTHRVPLSPRLQAAFEDFILHLHLALCMGLGSKRVKAQDPRWL